MKYLFYLRGMEKEMSRKILFDKKSQNPPTEMKAKKETSAKAKKEEKPKEAPKEVPSTPVNLIDWLKAHDLIKIRPLCLKAKIDPGTFHRWVNVTKEIPEDALKKIIPILKDYGFNASV